MLLKLRGSRRGKDVGPRIVDLEVQLVTYTQPLQLVENLVERIVAIMPRTKAEEGTARVTAPASKKRKASALDDSKAAAEIDARQSHSGRKSARLGAVDVNSPGGSATAKKSKYFAPGSSESDSDADVDADAEEVESGYEDEDASMTEQSEGSEPEDEYESSGSDRKPHRRARRGTLNAGRRTSPLLVNKADLWREGVKTGLGPGTQVIIQKPKPRGDGGIRYVPGKIHPNTMEFLRDLRKNNDREWLKAHDPDFRQSWKDFENFLEILTEAIIEIDDTIPELPPKDVVFRIYRDIRFSRDPTPYKPHFSAAFSRTGRKGPYACYYLHLQPGGKCFVGSGLWHPDAEPLRLLRAAIDSHPERMTSVLLDTSIRQLIFGGVGEDEKKVVKALCAHNAENALKTKPKVRIRRRRGPWKCTDLDTGL